MKRAKNWPAIRASVQAGAAPRAAAPVLVLIAVLMMLPAPQLVGEDSLSIYTWRTRVEDAIAHADETGRTVFVYFAGSDWCGWCGWCGPGIWRAEPRRISSGCGPRSSEPALESWDGTNT